MTTTPINNGHGYKLDNHTTENDTILYTVDTVRHTYWNAEALNEIAPVLLVMISTIIGNLVLIVLIIHKPTRRRKRVNVFIVNLGIADLTVAFITMTTELLEAIFKQWVLGPFFCKCLLYLQVVTLSSTTFLLTGMSIDRYQVIVRPLKSLTQRPKIKSKVVTAWIMAFVFAIPQIFIFVQVEVFDKSRNTFITACKSSGYSDEWQRKFYFTFLTFYILLLPAGIMLFCYTEIAKAIWNRGEHGERSSKKNLSEKVSSSSPRMSIKRSAISSARRKVVFMTLSVIIAYLVCLTPYFIICLIRIYSQYSVKLRSELMVSQVIFMLHSALNPILYGLFTFKKSHLKSIFALFVVRPNSRGGLLKSPSRLRLGKGLFCFQKSSSGETSVILANHIAKEETSIKLRNREKSKYTPSFRVHSGNHHSDSYSQTDSWARSERQSHSSISSEEYPVCIHTSMAVENGSVVSNV